MSGDAYITSINILFVCSELSWDGNNDAYASDEVEDSEVESSTSQDIIVLIKGNWK